MVSVDARTVEEEGITLVAATLSGGAVPTRVTVDNRLDGPVWPPRRMGKPEAGWDEEGYEGVVPADGEIAIGYACPAPTADPPLDIVARERVEAAEDRDGDFEDADDVLRGLGTPAPPREAVPIALPEDGPEDEPHDGADTVQHEVPEDGDPDENDPADGEGRVDDRGELGPVDDRGELGRDVSADAGPDDVGTHEPGHPPQADLDLDPSTETAPEPVTAWLDVVEDRIERAEPLADAEDVPAATDALRGVGSLDEARDLEERRQVDAAHLREVATRANALAYRAERAAIPVDVLDRLA